MINERQAGFLRVRASAVCPDGKLKTAKGTSAKPAKSARNPPHAEGDPPPPIPAAVVEGEGTPRLNNKIPGGSVNEE